MRSSLLLSTLVLLMGGEAEAKVFAKLSPDLNCNVLFHKYNVEKANCMAGEQVQTIAFTKIENTGPFCLRTYKDSNCKEETNHRQFDITGNDNIAKVCRSVEHPGPYHSASKGAC